MRRVLLAIVLVVACGGASSEPPPVPSGSLGGMDLPPAKPLPSATAAKPPAPAPTADSESLSVPGPLALPCTDDTQCGLHRCNAQYGKCAFPCRGPADCLSSAECMSSLCVPVMPRP